MLFCKAYRPMSVARVGIIFFKYLNKKVHPECVAVDGIFTTAFTV